jgi:hypothetical protein
MMTIMNSQMLWDESSKSSQTQENENYELSAQMWTGNNEGPRQESNRPIVESIQNPGNTPNAFCIDHDHENVMKTCFGMEPRRKTNVNLAGMVAIHCLHVPCEWNDILLPALRMCIQNQKCI